MLWIATRFARTLPAIVCPASSPELAGLLSFRPRFDLVKPGWKFRLGLLAARARVPRMTLR